MITVAKSLPELHATRDSWRTHQYTVALVPTMGNLHDGHLRLVEVAHQQADRVAVSIFVNPTQFCPGEDFLTYPRTLEEDVRKLDREGADLLFLPKVATMYPRDPATMASVYMPILSEELCGAYRPGHFRGVTTIVVKLFHLVQPDVAVFGEKDYQQLKIIQRVVEDIHIPVRIHSVATVRESNGLAMSSRNHYLTQEERTQAAQLYLHLTKAAESLRHGERNYKKIEHESILSLTSQGFRVDYFSIRDPKDLSLPSFDSLEWVILVAARLGKARLIDQLQVQYN